MNLKENLTSQFCNHHLGIFVKIPRYAVDFGYVESGQRGSLNGLALEAFQRGSRPVVVDIRLLRFEHHCEERSYEFYNIIPTECVTADIRVLQQFEVVYLLW